MIFLPLTYTVELSVVSMREEETRGMSHSAMLTSEMTAKVEENNNISGHGLSTASVDVILSFQGRVYGSRVKGKGFCIENTDEDSAVNLCGLRVNMMGE
ncbi:hypothetical protein E2C01_068218 [Portunus trituberculatus]|uniref:Uncharacterized protein n=1 Tax=Portunus trituberculatus TaxID=210409 RepID=A0A5B7HXB5_PORTR|nr:hypothetical protein [Portunus trituberculatus]